MHSGVQAAVLTAMVAAASPGLAQQRLSVGAELATDESRRGISWSENRLSPSMDATFGAGPLEASARVASTRGSDRHAGADAVADLGLAYSWDVGGVRLEANGAAHLFAGARGGMDYVEFGGQGSYTLGPARVSAGAQYAPDQDAIGGSNLYLYANASSGVPGTPFTLLAGVGRSSGNVDDPVRAARLRPDGRYSDWRLGIEYVVPFATLGLDYVGTDIDTDGLRRPFADLKHSGDRLVGRVRVSF